MTSIEMNKAKAKRGVLDGSQSVKDDNTGVDIDEEKWEDPMLLYQFASPQMPMDDFASDVKSISPDQKERLTRIVYTKAQLQILEDEFAKKSYPTKLETMEIAAKLGIDERRIKIWFTNKRVKTKAELVAKSMGTNSKDKESTTSTDARNYENSSKDISSKLHDGEQAAEVSSGDTDSYSSSGIETAVTPTDNSITRTSVEARRAPKHKGNPIARASCRRKNARASEVRGNSFSKVCEGDENPDAGACGDEENIVTIASRVEERALARASWDKERTSPLRVAMIGENTVANVSESGESTCARASGEQKTFTRASDIATTLSDKEKSATGLPIEYNLWMQARTFYQEMVDVCDHQLQLFSSTHLAQEGECDRH